MLHVKSLQQLLTEASSWIFYYYGEIQFINKPIEPNQTCRSLNTVSSRKYFLLSLFMTLELHSYKNKFETSNMVFQGHQVTT